MPLDMPDSVRVADLPPGYPAYLGYADGEWPTEAGLRTRFPTARLVILTVTAATLNADGIDIEDPDNPNAERGVLWAADKLAVAPDSRPVLYASVLGAAGYGMHDVLAELARRGIARNRVRLLSAHYGEAQHICGPLTCGDIGVDMDGTQWTKEFVVHYPKPGVPVLVDMSVLRDDFFAVTRAETATEAMVRELGIVREADKGNAVRTVQALCVARGALLVIDGDFGWRTKGAVEMIQGRAGLTVDGVVGPKTWPVLLGLAP